VNAGTAAPAKRAAQIAACIEADIIGRGWPVGESLGSEHDLRQRYGGSRSVLREAVRLVEHLRVARMRRGPGGGLFVSAPDAVPAARAVVIYLEYRGADTDDLLAARAVLEPLAATELSKNPVLQLFIEVLMRLSERYATRRAEPNDSPPGKRAELLAATIGEDIAASNLPAGSVFATEAELLNRYGVSRSVLREAVRLLEFHTIARTRRGPGGGLLVTEPLEQASIDTFALYLQYRKPSRQDLRVVRDAIELGTGNTVLELFVRILDALVSQRV
jgi:DNA-binding FadR family transcriptional regulator